MQGKDSHMGSFNPNTSDYYLDNGQHVHEIIGSTVFAEIHGNDHNHRFATVSDAAIAAEGSHFHNVIFRTDTHDGHYHEFLGPSSLAIPIGDGHHLHFINGCTKSADGHAHEFRNASLLNNVIDKY